MGKKTNTAKKKFLKKLLYSLLGLLLFSFIYPFVPGLLPAPENYDTMINSAGCAAVPIDMSMAIMAAALIGLFAFYLPMVLGFVKSAIYVKLWGVSCIFMYGIWFAGMSYVTVLCTPLLEDGEYIVYSMMLFAFASAMFFLFYMRPRLNRLVEINPAVFDFEKMEYWMTGPLIRPDGRSNALVGPMMMAGALLGLGLGNLAAGDMLGLDGEYKDMIFVTLLWLVGFYFAGVMAVSETYLTWLIYRESWRAKRTIVVKELI